jgi:hypothetical protein
MVSRYQRGRSLLTMLYGGQREGVEQRGEVGSRPYVRAAVLVAHEQLSRLLAHFAEIFVLVGSGATLNIFLLSLSLFLCVIEIGVN